MWKFVKLAFAAFLVFAGGVGVHAVLSGQVEETARSIIANGVDTVGVIEKREKHTVTARVGKVAGGGSYYTISYNYPVADGRRLSGEINVSKEQAMRAQDGGQIAIRYDSQTPTVHSPLDYEDYMTEEDIAELPYAMMLAMYGLLMVGGAFWAWLNWRRIAGESFTAKPAAASNRRVEALAGSRANAGGGFGRR